MFILVREVREEVGIGVGNVRSFGSQPWPFPHSLMIGFMATWESGEIVVDGEELKVSSDADLRGNALIDAWVRED